jgi:hypothetical protein
MDTWPGAEAVVQPEASDEEQGLDSDDEEKRKEKEEETNKEDWKDRREKATNTQNLTV